MAKEDKYGKKIFIASRREGFRRCGIAHPAELTEYPAGTFTIEQVERLKSEPVLIVSDMGTTKTSDAREKALDEREKALDAREADIAKREEALKNK